MVNITINLVKDDNGYILFPYTFTINDNGIIYTGFNLNIQDAVNMTTKEIITKYRMKKG
jgi:hypothetical protein